MSITSLDRSVPFLKALNTVKLMVPWLEIDPISVSGGNITVRGSTVKGVGSLNANGAPVISVINNSNLALKLNEAGCDVNFLFAWNRPHSGDYALDELFAWLRGIM